jgi:hypothetical protein
VFTLVKSTTENARSSQTLKHAAQHKSHAGAVEVQLPRHAEDSASTVVSACSSRKTPKRLTLQARYRSMFSAAFEHLKAAVSTRCPSSKLQHLTKCLRESSQQISNFYRELYNRPGNACCDELMDALVILLCNVEGPLLSKLYCQIMLLADIIPPFFKSGPFSFTLVQFVCACQFIQDRTVMKQNRNDNKT